MLAVNATATLLEILVIHNTTNREPICDALSLNLLWLLGRLAIRGISVVETFCKWFFDTMFLNEADISVR